jgi:hypothetical protein
MSSEVSCDFIFFHSNLISGVMSLFCLLGRLKSYNFSRVDTSFMEPSINAPLSWQVDGIVGQTNTLSNPPFHVDHRDVIVRALGAT